jgi:hypothetical protein
MFIGLWVRRYMFLHFSNETLLRREYKKILRLTKLFRIKVWLAHANFSDGSLHRIRLMAVYAQKELELERMKAFALHKCLVSPIFIDLF